MYASGEQERKVQRNSFHGNIYKKERVKPHYDDKKVNHVYLKGPANSNKRLNTCPEMAAILNTGGE